MADINMSHSKNKISASEQVLTEPNFAEVMQRILSYAMLVIPAVGLAIQHDEVQDREDFWLDEHVQSLLHHEGVASYKAVRRLWADEINRGPRQIRPSSTSIIRICPTSSIVLKVFEACVSDDYFSAHIDSRSFT